ncbi:MAG TPA: spore germination protein, partial [Bacillota bacterium]
MTGHLPADRAILAARLGYGKSFDVIFHGFDLGDRAALLITLDGFFKDGILLRITQFLLSQVGSTPIEESLRKLQEQGIAYAENELAGRVDDVVMAVLSGQAALLVDGLRGALLIDERTYPARGPSEPDTEKVVRGPKDGFTETLIANTALIRRRLRDPQLRFELMTVGERSQIDVAIAYIEDITDPELVALVRRRLQRIDVDAIPMATRSIEEFLVPRKRWWNPFPTVRYSERPDVVVPHLLEGHVVVLADTSPAAMILPVTFFHHLQHAQEFLDEPVTGAFVRGVRILGFIVAWFAPALWLGLVLSKPMLPQGFDVLGPREPGVVPIALQFVIAELAASLVWVALIHTPDTLSTSLGLIGTLLLGQQAIAVGLFSAEALFYIAAAFIGTFATPSLELANAVRVMRFLLLVLTAIGRLPGFVIGALLTVWLMVSTR